MNNNKSRTNKKLSINDMKFKAIVSFIFGVSFIILAFKLIFFVSKSHSLTYSILLFTGLSLVGLVFLLRWAVYHDRVGLRRQKIRANKRAKRKAEFYRRLNQ